MPPPCVGNTVESGMACSLLAVKSLSRLHVPMFFDQLGCLTHDSETLNCGAPDNENLNYCKLKKSPFGTLERESLKGVEVHIGGDPKGDNCEALISKRLIWGSMAQGVHKT